MKKMKKQLTYLTMALTLASCGDSTPKQTASSENPQDIQWQIDQFDDVKILQYRVGGFEALPLEQKKLIYYLSQAALCGRDILFDQHNRYNLQIRQELEKIYTTFLGNKTSPDWKAFEIYLKKVWFANGIHHHYSNDKFTPEFSKDYYVSLLEACSIDADHEILSVIFDPEVMPKRVSQDATKDLITASSVNFYQGVTQKEMEDFYTAMSDPNDKTPISYGLNSRLVKDSDGKITEEVYKLGGKYSEAIEKIIYWLEKAATVAQNDHQRQTIEYLVDYYKTGDLRKFDQYNVQWVRDTISSVDFVNGFIENYTDPMGVKATWESIVNFKDMEATKRTEKISDNAQWFEDNSPVDQKFKKPVVKGVSAKVITAAIIGGDCYPATPIGINLPNADWIRRDHGSKSVTIANFTKAYDMAASGSGFGAEFYLESERERIKQYSAASHDVAVDLHECLGHGSGQLLPTTKGDELKNYSSPLEETRAELFALYYIADPKLVELGVLPTLEAAKAEYYTFIFNGMMGQLTRLKQGANIEQAHMRSRALISWWAYELGKKENVIELENIDGKTFVKINDYDKLRTILGEMLAEIQRIKSEGDYAAGAKLIEDYAVRVDQKLHKEVLDRYSKLGIAPYSGFVNPVYELVENENGEIVDVSISYPANYVQQHLLYSNEYSFL